MNRLARLRPFLAPAVLAAFVAAGAPSAAQSPGPRLPAPESRGEPATTGSMASIVADLEALALAEMAKQKVPGLSFAVVQGDRVLHAKGYGVRKAGTSAPVSEHTLFEIGSTTKAFSSALVGMLVDEGRLSWSDRVVDHLPRFQLFDPWAAKEFRVDDLMAQRSGMPGWSLDDMLYLGYSRRQYADAVAFVEPVFSFRAEFGYVNSLWLFTGDLVEKSWGLSWENALSRRVFGPLGMTETTADPEVISRVEDVASGHALLSDGTLWVVPADWPYATATDTLGPAGGLRSTAYDMTRWVRLHLGGGSFEGRRLLSTETLSRLHAARTNVASVGARSTSYAQGWMYDSRASGPAIWHNGTAMKGHSIVSLYPSVGVGLVVLTNGFNNTVPEIMEGRLYALLFPGTPLPTAADAEAASSLLRPPPTRRFDPSTAPRKAAGPDGVVPPLPVSRYVGAFSNPAFGPVEIREKGGLLSARIGPRGTELPLKHYAGNVFVTEYPGWPETEFLVNFDVPAGGGATRVQFERFGYVRGGWFERTGP